MQKARAIIGLVAAFALMGLLAACGADEPTPTSAATATPTPAATPTPLPPGVTAEPTPTPDAFLAEWAELIALAQAEGEVVIALGGSDSRTGRFAFETFKRQFGIEVLTSSGSGSDNANRILAEQGRGIFTVDVVTVSGGSLERLRAAGALSPVSDWLIHPSVIDRSEGWWLTETIWSDMDSKYVMADSLAVGPIGDIWYNPENVTQEDLNLINEYRDLLLPRFKGRIAMRAMNSPGGKSVIARLWLTPGLGPDFLDALHRVAEVALVNPEGDKELAEGVANGKWDFGIFGGGRDFRALQNLQLPVRELTLTKQVGGLSTEMSGGNGMLKDPPHPNAAKLFLNWWYTQEGQTADVESVSAYGPKGSVSLRSDVTQGTFPDHLWEAVQQIPQWRADGTIGDHLVVFETNEEWFQVREQTEKFFNDLYNELDYRAFVTF